MKKLILFALTFSSMLVLPSCNNNDNPDVIKTDVEVTSITFKTKVQEMKIGDTLKLDYEVTPNNATKKDVSFTSDNESVLKVDNEGIVTALSEGEATIKVSLIDTTLSDSLTIVVTSSKEYYLETLNSLLDKSLLLEKEKSNGGNFNEASFSVYKESLQVNYSSNNKIKYYLEGDSLKELYLNNKTITDNKLGTLNDDLTQDQVDNYLKLFRYTFENKTLFGISNIVKELLNGKYFYGYQNALESLNVTFNEDKDKALSTYNIKTKYIDDSTSYDEKYYDNSLSFSFNDKELVSGSYKINAYNKKDYDESSKTLMEGANPIKTLTSSFNLIYLTERINEDDTALNKSDYLIKSFEIDTSNFRNKGVGDALLYVNDEVLLEYKNILPEVHLSDTFTISNISDESVLTTTKNGKVEYLKALKEGEATVTVETSMLKSASIKIKVSSVPVNKIEIGTTSLTKLDINQSATYKVDVYPFDVADKTWTAKFESEDMAKLATLTTDMDNSTFSLKALAAGKVKVIVTSNANSDVSTSIEVTINAPASGVDAVKNLMIGSTYKAYPGTIKFIDETNAEGDFSNSAFPNNKCTFNWSIEEKDGKYVFTITNLKKDENYSTSGFSLKEGSQKNTYDINYISEDAKQLVVYTATYTGRFNKQ